MKVASLEYRRGSREITVVASQLGESDLAIELLNSFLSSTLVPLRIYSEEIKDVLEGVRLSDGLTGGGGFVRMDIELDYCTLSLWDSVRQIKYTGKVATSEVYTVLHELSEMDDQYPADKKRYC